MKYRCPRNNFHNQSTSHYRNSPLLNIHVTKSMFINTGIEVLTFKQELWPKFSSLNLNFAAMPVKWQYEEGGGV